jgi:hypothetical protein
MKKTIQISISVIAVIILCILHSAGNMAFAQKTKGAIKIGTYDSRIVAFAWSRTDYLKQHMIKFNQQNDSAEKSHDSVRLKEVFVGGISYQHLLDLYCLKTSKK